MSNPIGSERRRHPRHRLRLRIQFLRGEAEVAAEIFNISRSGCLIVTPVAMRPGERVLVHVPALSQSPQSLQVVRIHAVGKGPWFAVAAHFDPYLEDDAPLLKLASQDSGPQEDPEQLF